MADPRECVRCKEAKLIAGRGLCRQCHTFVYRHGNIEDYPKDNKGHVKRYDFCIDCEEYKHISGQNRCKNCYQKFRKTPEEKAKRAEVERQRRAQNREEYNKKERERNQRRKEERAEYNKKYYAENAEKLKQYQREWQRSHPQRRDDYKRKYIARKNSLPDTLTEQEWKEILAKFNHLCAYCGSDGDLVKEHWLPASKGGGYTAENIVPACSTCNSSKGSKTGEQFLRILDKREWNALQETFEKEVWI